MRVFVVLALLAPVVAGAAATPDGKVLYAQKCSKCHGADGTAPTLYAKKGAPDFKDPDWQKTMTDAEMARSIAEGSEGTLMRPFKGEMGPGEILSVVRYVRKLQPAPR